MSTCGTHPCTRVDNERARFTRLLKAVNLACPPDKTRCDRPGFDTRQCESCWTRYADAGLDLSREAT